MTQLEFDFGVAPGWVPLYKPFGLSFANLMVERGCRDCGGEAGGETGGADERGVYNLCPGCSQLDGCLRRESRTAGWHCSRWGESHSPEGHDVLSVAREKRRTSWRRRAARSINEGGRSDT